MQRKLPLLNSIHATYGRIQMTEMQKSLSETSMWPAASCGRKAHGFHGTFQSVIDGFGTLDNKVSGFGRERSAAVSAHDTPALCCCARALHMTDDGRCGAPEEVTRLGPARVSYQGAAERATLFRRWVASRCLAKNAAPRRQQV